MSEKISVENIEEANRKEIERAYGKKRLKTANIGWATGSGECCSKVYGSSKETTMLVTTSIRNGKFVHSHVQN